MTLSFKYKLVRRLNGKEVKTPSIPILLHGKEAINTIALIDSGADVSALPIDMAELLGLDLSGEKTDAFGIGGRVPSLESKIVVTISKGYEKYNFYLPVKILFNNNFPILLGRAGFFDEFIITFDQPKARVHLKSSQK